MSNKTKPTDVNVDDFVASIEDDTKRSDCETLVELMRDITGKPGQMWGSGMVGFGEYHYVYESGREGDSFVTGFAPRARNLSIYLMDGFDSYQELLDRLGPYKTGKSCLYVTRLERIDLDVLRELVERSVDEMRERYNLD